MSCEALGGEKHLSASQLVIQSTFTEVILSSYTDTEELKTNAVPGPTGGVFLKTIMGWKGIYMQLIALTRRLCFHPRSFLGLCVCLFVCKQDYKKNVFPWNFVLRWSMGQRWNHHILVQIQFRIFCLFFSLTLRETERFATFSLISQRIFYLSWWN